MKLQYVVEIEEDDCNGRPCFVATHPELPGCMANGKTRGEALKNLEEARSDYIRILLKRGLEVPLPKAAVFG